MLLIMLLPVNATTQDRRLDSADDYSDRLWNKERPNIEKLAQFTSRQGGAILFTID